MRTSTVEKSTARVEHNDRRGQREAPANIGDVRHDSSPVACKLCFVLPKERLEKRGRETTEEEYSLLVGRRIDVPFFFFFIFSLFRF